MDEYSYTPGGKLQRNDNIRAIQQILNDVRTDTHGNWERLEADGAFDLRTRNAVKAFQSSIGMPATGVMNETTQRALLDKHLSNRLKTDSILKGGTVGSPAFISPSQTYISAPPSQQLYIRAAPSSQTYITAAPPSANRWQPAPSPVPPTPFTETHGFIAFDEFYCTVKGPLAALFQDITGPIGNLMEKVVVTTKNGTQEITVGAYIWNAIKLHIVKFKDAILALWNKLPKMPKMPSISLSWMKTAMDTVKKEGARVGKWVMQQISTGKLGKVANGVKSAGKAVGNGAKAAGTFICKTGKFLQNNSTVIGWVLQGAHVIYDCVMWTIAAEKDKPARMQAFINSFKGFLGTVAVAIAADLVALVIAGTVAVGTPAAVVSAIVAIAVAIADIIIMIWTKGNKGLGDIAFEYMEMAWEGMDWTFKNITSLPRSIWDKMYEGYVQLEKSLRDMVYSAIPCY